MKFLAQFKNILPLIIICGFILVWFDFPNYIYDTLAIAGFTEAIAILLSIIAVYSYTNIDFLQTYMTGADGKMSAYEQTGSNIVIGHIFLGVHILVGLCGFTIFLAMSNG